MTPLVIGIAGGSGSGKTTVTNAIIAAVGAAQVALLQQDSYYRDFGALSPEQRLAINWDHPDALEDELLIAHVAALRAGRRSPYPATTSAPIAASPRGPPVSPAR